MSTAPFQLSHPPSLNLKKIAGGWFIVVMEYMAGYVFTTLKDPASISAQLRQLVTDIVTSFHANNLVHGDIRDSNFLVRVDGKLDRKLIVFDWGGKGGKEGEVRYAVLINNRTVFRRTECDWRPAYYNRP